VQGDRRRRGASGVDAPDLASNGRGRSRFGSARRLTVGERRLLILDVSASKVFNKSRSQFTGQAPPAETARSAPGCGDPPERAHARTSASGAVVTSISSCVHRSPRASPRLDEHMWQRCPGWPDWDDAPSSRRRFLIAGFLAQLADARRHRVLAGVDHATGDLERESSVRSETGARDKAAVRGEREDVYPVGAETR